MRVLFVLAGTEERASTRLRVLELLPHLEQKGIETATLSPVRYGNRVPGPSVLGYLISLVALVFRAPFYDVVLLQKAPLPGPYVRLLDTLAGDVVYDIDDALYAKPEWKDNRDWARLFLNGTLRAASLVVSGNESITEYVDEHCSTVVTLPTAIPRSSAPVGSENDDVIRLLWIGNPENVRHLALIEQPLRRILETWQDVKLTVVTKDAPERPLVERDDVKYRRWSLAVERESLAESDIGIRPLPDDEWTRSKGGFTSVVQMMGAALPVVVSPVGSLSNLVTDGQQGFHAKTDDDWISALERLLEDEDRRERIGENARATVDEEGYWTEDRGDDLADVFRSLED